MRCLLKEGRRTAHPELALFTRWGYLQVQLAPKERAEVTVSPAHKAKGGE
ncbi:hypothetical protein [Streptomyces sp. NPDC003032]